MADLRLAIEVQATGARLAVVGAEGIHDLRRSTRTDAPALAEAIAVLRDRAPAAIDRVGLAIAPHAGLAAELHGLTGLSVVAHALGTCLAAGERLQRPGDFVLLSLGGAPAAGAVVDDRVWRPDTTGLALGHLVVDPTGARCACGRRGCLATIVTDAGLKRLAAFHSLTVLPRHLQSKANLGIGPGSDAILPGLAARAAAGESKAAALLDDVGRAVGLALAAAAQVLGVRVALLGTDPTTQTALLPRVEACLRRHAMGVEVAAARPAADAALLGAAALA